MKIAILRRSFDALGGAELYLQRLLRLLIKKEHEVHLFAEHWGPLPREIQLHDLNLSHGRAARVRRYDQNVRAAVSRELFDIVFSLERTQCQDVYRAGDGVHRVWLNQRRLFVPWWRRLFVGWGAFHRAILDLEARTFDGRNTRHVIVNSEMVRREIMEYFQFPEARIHLVRNGVELEHWRAGDRKGTRASWGVERDEFLLLFAGSGWERKGLRFVIAALEQMGGRVKLVVAGKGKPSWGGACNVIFSGPMKDLNNAYAAADLFVFPPIYDPSANVCFEALAAGLPVVTSACNGASEVIEERINGTVLKDPSDIEALVAAIKFWREQSDVRPVPVKADLSLERNVRETLEVLMLAARERAAERS